MDVRCSAVVVKGGLVFDPRNVSNDAQPQILRIVTNVADMSVTLHGPTQPAVLLTLCKVGCLGSGAWMLTPAGLVQLGSAHVAC